MQGYIPMQVLQKWAQSNRARLIWLTRTPQMSNLIYELLNLQGRLSLRPSQRNIICLYWCLYASILNCAHPHYRVCRKPASKILHYAPASTFSVLHSQFSCAKNLLFHYRSRVDSIIMIPDWLSHSLLFKSFSYNILIDYKPFAT